MATRSLGVVLAEFAGWSGCGVFVCVASARVELCLRCVQVVAANWVCVVVKIESGWGRRHLI